jgi:hypothetical protein
MEESEETGLPTEPEEEDWVTQDYCRWYQYNNPREVFYPETEHWGYELKLRMDIDGFWPNCWYLGERGDWNLLDLETETFMVEKE